MNKVSLPLLFSIFVMLTVGVGIASGNSAAGPKFGARIAAPAAQPNVWLNGKLRQPVVLADAADDAAMGKWLGGAALAVAAIGSLLAFIRKESKMEEPTEERRVSGGPIEIEHKRQLVDLRDHAALADELKLHRAEVWTVINGLRSDITEIKEDLSAIRVLREANGDRLQEVSRELSGLEKAVSHLSGLIEGKEGKAGARR